MRLSEINKVAIRIVAESRIKKASLLQLSLLASLLVCVYGTKCGAQCTSTNASTPVTISDETGKIPGSVQIVNGTNTTVNTTVPGRVSIDATSGGGDVNLTQIGGNTVATGNGTTNTGTQRVTISSDSTGQLSAVGSITTSVTPGTSAAHLGKAEDAAHASGDTGVAVYGVRQDSNAGFCADGDYSPFAVNSQGAQKTVTEPSLKATFTACNPQYTVPATPNDMVTFFGSGSKITKILRIELLTEQTTAGTNLIYLYRRTGTPTGSANTVTAFQHDTSSAAATATMSYYTTDPTVGAGTTKFLDGWDTQAPAAGSNIQPNWREVFNASTMGAPIVLRSASEGIAFNFNDVALPAGFKIQARITWTEE